MPEETTVNPHHQIGETFSDQVGSIMFDGATFRLDLLVNRMQPGSSSPKRESHLVCRLVLSPNCAVDLINQLNRLSSQLIQSGAMKEQTAAGLEKKTG
jgi:hypothetical protein